MTGEEIIEFIGHPGGDELFNSDRTNSRDYIFDLGSENFKFDKNLTAKELYILKEAFEMGKEYGYEIGRQNYELEQVQDEEEYYEIEESGEEDESDERDQEEIE